MLKLYDRFTSKGLVILGITTENKKEVTQIIDKNKITYPTLMGDERVLKNYNVNARPTYVFIDPEGHIIHYFYGLHKDLTSLLESTLK